MAGGAVCVGCGIPVAFELLGERKTELEGLIFKKEGEASQPILTCRGTKSNIQLSLAYKKGSDGRKELYWKGLDKNNGQHVNFEERIVGEHHRQTSQGKLGDYRWVLKVFRSGTTRLYQANEYNLSGHDPEEISCDSGIFEVITPTYSGADSWEKPVVSVKLIMKNCDTLSGKKQCDIDISDNVGLKWKSNFKPKAIFLI